EDRFLNSFGHIFAGGYAAGYYSYKWAEVLSADAFAAFEEAGLDNEAAVQATGRRYRDTVLALGGSHPPVEVFRAFRGREPATAALLRHSGLRSPSSPHAGGIERTWYIEANLVLGNHHL
ncbi:MAG: M3 family metallopeptidase, partial [Oscillatoriales cyanobacterium SM2_1_8]|nr:M3 family metallopeptidase [Oscillatoriales cyanobacterium SM2_1_8]